MLTNLCLAPERSKLVSVFMPRDGGKLGIEGSSAEAEPSTEQMPHKYLGCRPAAARLWLGLSPRNYPPVSPRRWEENRSK